MRRENVAVSEAELFIRSPADWMLLMTAEFCSHPTFSNFLVSGPTGILPVRVRPPKTKTFSKKYGGLKRRHWD